MPKLTNLKIVIAEDDNDDAMLIQDSFKGNGNFTSVTLVNNGQELLDYLQSSQLPDLILTDINMPIMDGIEAITKIYESEKLRHIPCFVYSTSINPTYQAKCEVLGVKGYIIKPYSFEDFNKIPDEIVSQLVES